MSQETTNLNTTVSCRNSQGQQIAANVLSLRRFSATFEVYNPFSLLQLSEVLHGFQIRLNDRIIYSGDAVVSNLVNTGILLVCEVTLNDAWLDIDFLSDREGGSSLNDQFTSFLGEWKLANTVNPQFKLITADLQSLLVGLQRWMEQADLGLRTSTSDQLEEMENQTIISLEDELAGQVLEAMSAFEQAARNIPLEDQASHKFYVRRQIHPLVLCSPFAYRTFYKPLGYAGDYEMVNMMLRPPYEGASLFAKSINTAFLKTPPVEAHRNRIVYLKKLLEETVVKNNGKRVRVLNLGCGPAHEIQAFIRESPFSDLCDVTLLDFNEETLQSTSGVLNDLCQTHGRTAGIETIHRSVHQLLKQASTGDAVMKWDHYDLVYCAGLFDYLSQRVCKRLTEIFYMLSKPGGKVAVTNVSASNPSIGWMEYILEWNLVYRDQNEMLELVPRQINQDQATLIADVTGVNLFLEVPKPRLS
ncbi:MAG: extracellular factor (EF) 3-hydroxypalmitic acid methyl ester biosynthesis protein [Akkermansiaceae bacterium]|jgi:extracellular factor (EF) 3-hydroxypalmitic acid methyl ester biosynthesis protein